MITLTDTDVVRLLRKNNLNSDTLQENVVAKLREKGVKLGLVCIEVRCAGT